MKCAGMELDPGGANMVISTEAQFLVSGCS